MLTLLFQLIDFKRNEIEIDVKNNEDCNEVLLKEDGKYQTPQIYINQLFQLSQKVPSLFDKQAIKDEIFSLMAAVCFSLLSISFKNFT